MVLTWAASYRVDVPRNDGERWSDGVAAAETAWGTEGGVATIVISPDASWTVGVPCADVSG